MTKRRAVKLQELLERVREASRATGRRAELARQLGCSRQQVNGWLSGDRMPGGEVTLQLLEWVQAEEAKQNKALGSATNTAQSKTRKPQSVHEKRIRVRQRT